MLHVREFTTTKDSQPLLPAYRDQDVILFEDGLIGFPDAQRFVLIEQESLSPFRILKCVDDLQIGFLVLDPRVVVKYYDRSIPTEAWASLSVNEKSDRLALVISIIGNDPQESTANLKAPILINHQKMLGKQMILTSSRFSVTQRLIPTLNRPARRYASSAC